MGKGRMMMAGMRAMRIWGYDDDLNNEVGAWKKVRRVDLYTRLGCFGLHISDCIGSALRRGS